MIKRWKISRHEKNRKRRETKTDTDTDTRTPTPTDTDRDMDTDTDYLNYDFCKYSQLHTNAILTTTITPTNTTVGTATRHQPTRKRVGALWSHHPGCDVSTPPWVPAGTPTVHGSLYGGRPWVARQQSTTRDDSTRRKDDDETKVTCATPWFPTISRQARRFRITTSRTCTMLPKIIVHTKFFWRINFRSQIQISGFRELISDAITERFCALPEP